MEISIKREMENRVSYNTFYNSWHEAMSELTDKQYGKLSRAINDYCFSGIMPELEGIVKMLFIAFKPNIDASNKAKEQGKKGGEKRKGGAPLGNKNAVKTKTEKDNTSLLDETIPPYCFEQYLPVEKNNSNGEGEGDEDVNGDENSDGDGEKGLSKLFISLWQENGDVFNAVSKPENPASWQTFWKRCNFSPGHIKTAVNNVANAVRAGSLERRFVPATPEKFVLNGWLQRGLDDFLSSEDRKERERQSKSRQDMDNTERLLAEYEKDREMAVKEGNLRKDFEKMIRGRR